MDSALPQSQTRASLASFRTRTPHPRHPRTSGFVELTTLLPLFPRLLIVGSAGCGKTTFLRLLAEEHEAVYVRLAASGRPPAVRADRSLLLLDGIDEVPASRRSGILEDIAAIRPERPIVITSRPVALGDVRALGFRQAAIEGSGEVPPPPSRRADRAARRLAFVMTVENARSVVIDRESAARAIGSPARIDGEILTEAGELIAFSSTLLQESLAAEELASMGSAMLPLLEPHLGDPLWNEVLARVPASDSLIQATLALAQATTDPIRRAHVLAFAARFANVRDSIAEHLHASAASLPATTRMALTDALDDEPPDPIADLLPLRRKPSVRIGRCPITAGQYRAFVDDGAEAPFDWDRQLRTPRHPVVNVSWHDASAYCAWLAHRSGRRIALPDSTEWESAATHDEGPYPWGAGDPDEERLNCDQRIGRTTPAGLYPRGVAPGGHLDLGGNVWEWCHDAAGEGRVVRGGGWFSNAQYAQSSYHYHFHADNRFHDLGFRIAEKEDHA